MALGRLCAVKHSSLMCQCVRLISPRGTELNREEKGTGRATQKEAADDYKTWFAAGHDGHTFQMTGYKGRARLLGTEKRRLRSKCTTGFHWTSSAHETRQGHMGWPDVSWGDP